MLLRILIAIITGIFLGYQSGLLVIYLLDGPESILYYSPYIGIFIGLLICLIVEVREIKEELIGARNGSIQMSSEK